MTDTLAALGMALVLLFPGAALSQSAPAGATATAEVEAALIAQGATRCGFGDDGSIARARRGWTGGTMVPP